MYMYITYNAIHSNHIWKVHLLDKLCLFITRHFCLNTKSLNIELMRIYPNDCGSKY